MVILLHALGPGMARSRRDHRPDECQLLGVERTSLRLVERLQMTRSLMAPQPPAERSGPVSLRIVRTRNGAGNGAVSCFEGGADTSPLGGVDSKESLLGANQIQGFFFGGSLGCDGSFGVERCRMGANGAADHRAA